MFRLTTNNIKFFGEILRIIKDASPEEFYMWTEKKGERLLKLGCIDPPHVVLSEFSLNMKGIGSMRGTINDKIIISDTKDLADIVGSAKKDNILNMTYKKDILKVIISDNKNNIYANADFDVELNDELPAFPRLDGYQEKNISSLVDFNEALKYQIQFCNKIKIRITDNTVGLEGERKRNGKKITSMIFLSPKSKIASKNGVESKVNSEFIRIIERTLRMADSADIYLKENAPLIFRFGLKEKLGEVKCFVSPLLEE